MTGLFYRKKIRYTPGSTSEFLGMSKTAALEAVKARKQSRSAIMKGPWTVTKDAVKRAFSEGIRLHFFRGLGAIIEIPYAYITLVGEERVKMKAFEKLAAFALLEEMRLDPAFHATIEGYVKNGGKYLFVDRKGHMILSSRSKMSPGELKTVLAKNTKVKRVDISGLMKQVKFKYFDVASTITGVTLKASVEGRDFVILKIDLSDSNKNKKTIIKNSSIIRKSILPVMGSPDDRLLVIETAAGIGNYEMKAKDAEMIIAALKKGA
ncbi:MAG: hypothetical protein NTY48_05650 [Candidatus Diapherotrites archaeon]|nr:hypothetical protein [Candidatus Diapherotrites archaeon]